MSHGPDPAQRFSLSAAERVALAGAALILLLQALPLGGVLEYRAAIGSTQPWRWISGHVIHINWPHALINAAAWVIVARLFAPDLSAPRQLLALLFAALVISAGLTLAWPTIEWYRGLSGALHGLFFAGATVWLIKARPRTLRALWLPAALLVGGWIKIALEWPGAELPYADWLGASIVPQAHLLGAACGTLLGLAWAALDARDRKQKQQ
jgi:rhomboid family GlyGly-CTERM serine protease